MGNCRHLQGWVNNNDTQSQSGNRTDFQEGRQIVARSQQEPNRQYGSHETVNHNRPSQLNAVKVEPVTEGAVGNIFTVNHGQHQQNKADDGNLADFARTDITGINTHKQGNRHSRCDGERTPRAVNQCFHNDQRQHRHDDDHNHQNTDGCNHAGDSTEFLFHDIAQRLTVTAHGDEQDHHILYGTGKHHAEDNPQSTGQITHLRCQYRTDQRTCAGNRGKVVAEQYAFMCGHIVQTVIVAFCRSQTVRIKLHHTIGNVKTVKTVGNAVYRNGGRNHPNRTDLLATAES